MQTDALHHAQFGHVLVPLGLPQDASQARRVCLSSKWVVALERYADQGFLSSLPDCAGACFPEARLLSVMRDLNALEWELSSVGGAGAVREDVALQRWAQLMSDHRKRVEVRRC